MGVMCSTAACYRRYATTDEYDEDAIWYTNRPSSTDRETFLFQQLGKFRYEVHALSLMIPPYERCRTKAIYLYIDGVRVMAARLTFEAGNVRFVALQYRSVFWRDHYHDTTENVPKGRAPALLVPFQKYFDWFQSGEGSYNIWPFTLYRSKAVISEDERESLSRAYQISI